MKKSLDRRWCVVLDLQERLQKLQPGSEAANILERAIFLAINKERSLEVVAALTYR